MRVFHKGDTLATLRSQIRDKSVNLIYVNPPFGTTKNYWDEKQDWHALFAEFFRVLTDDGMLVIHCSIPFNYELIRCAPKAPSYSWYWDKGNTTCPLIANHQPLRRVEEVLVWKNKRNTYYRQQIGDEPRETKWMTASSYYGSTVEQTSVVIGKTRSHLIQMPRTVRGFATRPDAMMDLFIKSYSKDGDVVLDPFCYKGLSSKFCAGRRWIGIDKYFYPTDWF